MSNLLLVVILNISTLGWTSWTYVVDNIFTYILLLIITNIGTIPYKILYYIYIVINL